MRILGIDPGISITGYGIIEVQGRELRCLHHGGIRNNGSAAFSEKLLTIHENLIEIAREYQPGLCAVENIFYHQNKKTAIVMGHARAAAMLAAARINIPVFEYSPREVKMSIVGNGNASKTQVQAMVANLLKLGSRPTPADAADALAVAMCHYHRQNFLKHL
ncbi:MAG: crossover junction endodeoxyribonuclease RuvC [Calditrichia bacterium]